MKKSVMEMLAINDRPFNPKAARNKNVLITGGSVSGIWGFSSTGIHDIIISILWIL
jgi:hypothetical protein